MTAREDQRALNAAAARAATEARTPATEREAMQACETARRLFRNRRRAWTGGTRPAPLARIDAIERALVQLFYVEQIDTWQDYWHETPPADVIEIFWNRARGDAHATLREFKREEGKSR
jgi:hypothetical protein